MLKEDFDSLTEISEVDFEDMISKNSYAIYLLDDEEDVETDADSLIGFCKNPFIGDVYCNPFNKDIKYEVHKIIEKTQRVLVTSTYD